MGGSRMERGRSKLWRHAPNDGGWHEGPIAHRSRDHRCMICRYNRDDGRLSSKP